MIPSVAHSVVPPENPSGPGALEDRSAECIPQFVPGVGLRPKCRLSLGKADLYIAESALQHKKQPVLIRLIIPLFEKGAVRSRPFYLVDM